jgi:hypothetical protein
MVQRAIWWSGKTRHSKLSRGRAIRSFVSRFDRHETHDVTKGSAVFSPHDWMALHQRGRPGCRRRFCCLRSVVAPHYSRNSSNFTEVSRGTLLVIKTPVAPHPLKTKVIWLRGSAWLLILLVVCPFTAPFSSCDLSILLEVAHYRDVPSSISDPHSSASMEASRTEDATGSFLEEEQFKVGALPAASTATVAIRTYAAPAIVTRTAVSRFRLVTLRL